MAEIVTLAEAVSEFVRDGQTVALEGFTHLIPFAAGHELLRQGRTELELIRAVRGPNYDDAAHYLRQFMAQLRHKLEPDPARPQHLLTEPGMGYRFQP